MPTIAPPQRAPAPLAQPLRTNLIQSAVNPQDRVRWEPGGVAFNPLNHGFNGSTAFGTFDPCTPGTLEESTDPTNLEANPVGLYIAEKCSALAGDSEALASRALQRLNTQNSHLLERWFWTGEAAGAAWTESGTFLTDAPVTPIGTTPVAVIAGFSEMIDAFTTYLGGERGMIHVPAKLLPYIATYDLGFQQGNTIVTSLGSHLIVPGTGYLGTGPSNVAADAGATWIYGTSLVEVRLSDPRVIAGPDAMDRSINDDFAYATQLGLAYFDKGAHIGIQVTLG